MSWTAELRLNGCTLTVLPANPTLAAALKLKTKSKSFEWQCPECGAENSLKISNLPYEFAGGDNWTQVMRSATYIMQLNKLVKSEHNLISFLARKIRLEKEILGENSRLKLSASTRIKEKCPRCRVEVAFNVELSSNKSSLLEKTRPSHEDLKTEIGPEDDENILNRLLRGFNIYLLMEKFSLAIDLDPKSLDGISVDMKRLGNMRDLVKRIESLRNDIEKILLFDKVEAEIENITENFQTNEALMSISEILSFITGKKNSVVKNLRRKLFLSLAYLEEQIENIIILKV